MMDILPSGGTQSYIYRFSKIEDPGNVTNPPDESETAVSQMSNEMDKMFFEVDPDIERTYPLLVAHKLIIKLFFRIRFSSYWPAAISTKNPTLLRQDPRQFFLLWI